MDANSDWNMNSSTAAMLPEKLNPGPMETSGNPGQYSNERIANNAGNVTVPMQTDLAQHPQTELAISGPGRTTHDNALELMDFYKTKWSEEKRKMDAQREEERTKMNAMLEQVSHYQASLEASLGRTIMRLSWSIRYSRMNSKLKQLLKQCEPHLKSMPEDMIKNFPAPLPTTNSMTADSGSANPEATCTNTDQSRDSVEQLVTDFLKKLGVDAVTFVKTKKKTLAKKQSGIKAQQAILSPDADHYIKYYVVDPGFADEETLFHWSNENRNAMDDRGPNTYCKVSVLKPDWDDPVEHLSLNSLVMKSVVREAGVVCSLHQGTFGGRLEICSETTPTRWKDEAKSTVEARVAKDSVYLHPLPLVLTTFY
ncbi:hypothetical protein B0H10DRAFT_1962641 [Mycena sp. CBHHK59/15]|nr:hypothetical protein B0H10DRAFT_1962641 [Mycena sp. CBHHK59/15]